MSDPKAKPVEVVVPFEGVCVVCCGTIPKDSTAVFIPHEGMHHPTCVRVK